MSLYKALRYHFLFWGTESFLNSSLLCAQSVVSFFLFLSFSFSLLSLQQWVVLFFVCNRSCGKTDRTIYIIYLHLYVCLYIMRKMEAWEKTTTDISLKKEKHRPGERRGRYSFSFTSFYSPLFYIYSIWQLKQ